MRASGWLVIAASLLVWTIGNASGRAQGGDVQGQFSFDGRVRSYLLHRPPQASGGRPIPLVMLLHGGGGNASGMERMSGMNAIADKEGFFVVYPDGTAARGQSFTWNAGACCGYALTEKVDDVGFLTALLDKFEAELPVDRSLIAVGGISNGAMMAYRFGAERAERVAAIASVSGTIGGQAKGQAAYVIPMPKVPVAVVAFHGTNDRYVPYEGGASSSPFAKGREDLSVAQSMAFWSRSNGCSSQSTRAVTAHVRLTEYGGCRTGGDVWLYTIEGGEHSWPGGHLQQTFLEGTLDPLGMAINTEISASELMWSFFVAHRHAPIPTPARPEG